MTLRHTLKLKLNFLNLGGARLSLLKAAQLTLKVRTVNEQRKVRTVNEQRKVLLLTGIVFTSAVTVLVALRMFRVARLSTGLPAESLATRDYTQSRVGASDSLRNGKSNNTSICQHVP